MMVAIPVNHPYGDNDESIREEIYAYGLRNPWRFSFDAESGELWVADVGQEKWEEINIVEKGGNYGWNIFEDPEATSRKLGGRKPGSDFQYLEFVKIRMKGPTKVGLCTGGPAWRGSSGTISSRA